MPEFRENAKKKKQIYILYYWSRSLLMSMFLIGNEKKRIYLCTNFCIVGIYLYAQELFSVKLRTQ